mgnify:FL=1
MPIDEVTISRRCSNCGTEIEVVAVKKDNMMLSSKELVSCPKCETEHPEVRDIVGRLESIKTEQESYPPSATVGPDRSTPER